VSFVNFNLDLVGTECAASSFGFLEKWALSISEPFIVAAALSLFALAGYVVIHVRHRRNMMKAVRLEAELEALRQHQQASSASLSSSDSLHVLPASRAEGPASVSPLASPAVRREDIGTQDGGADGVERAQEEETVRIQEPASGKPASSSRMSRRDTAASVGAFAKQPVPVVQSPADAAHELAVEVQDWAFLQITGLVTLADITYIPMAITVFRLFDCVGTAGLWYLRSSPSVSCVSTEYERALVAGVLLGLLYILVIPIVLLTVLRRRAQSARLFSERATLLQLGVLYVRFHEDRWWWHGVVLARRMLFVATAIYMGPWPTYQALCGLIILSAVIVLMVAFRPFRRTVYYVAEAVSTSALYAMLFFGIAFAGASGAAGMQSGGTTHKQSECCRRCKRRLGAGTGLGDYGRSTCDSRGDGGSRDFVLVSATRDAQKRRHVGAGVCAC
jgi:hypothetical protein